MARRDEAPFPLVARRRIAGTPFGAVRSGRRGPGTDLAGLRPYRPGDDVRLVDRHASARASTAAASDVLVVREHLTEEATGVVVLVDGAPTMDLFPGETPWLSKPAAVEASWRAIEASARRAGCALERVGPDGPLDAALIGLLERGRPPRPGSFVFAISDYLAPPADAVLARALAARVDLVPVVVQDPTWEQSFPPVAGTVVPLAEPSGGRRLDVLLTRAEVEERRRANETRLGALQRRFDALGLDHVLLSTSDSREVAHAFLAWSVARQTGGRLR